MMPQALADIGIAPLTAVRLIDIGADGIAVQPSAPGIDDDRPRLLTGPATIESVRRGLASPYRGFLEPSGVFSPPISPGGIGAVLSGGLVLALSTRSACSLPVVELVGAAVRSKVRLPLGESAELMEICLAEAISNAVIHGNLGIPDHLRATAQGFQRFRLAMRERLEDPELSSRRVEIRLREENDETYCLSVSDQGAGFDPESQIRRDVRADARSGRGLGLIRQACVRMCSEEGGRTLAMTFRRGDGRRSQ